MFGDLDLDAVSFNLEKIQYIDYGTDFYAPQTCTDPNGRTVLVGWAKSWDGPVHIDNMHWTGMMTIPRELSLVDGVLRQKPISTIESLRKNTVCKVCELDSELVELEEIRARVLDINLELEAGASAENFTLSLAKGDKYKTDISFDFASEKLTLDRTFAGIRQDIVMKRSMPIEMSDSKISVRVLIDRYVIEVFAQDGEKVMTSLINTPIEMDGLSLSASGRVNVSLEAHELEL